MSNDLTEDALYYHRFPRPGKLEIQATKPLANQRDLALAYSPGVAAACREIVRDPREVATVTSRANLVAVISNGTAVLGLGDIGALAAKPVMEGKAVLFKQFAGIDVFDIEINEKNPDKLIEIIASLEPTFGAINLEDIKSPECFMIERKLKERMKIPVFHDDQHGTAICVGAAVLNGLRLQNKAIESVKLVTSGAGAAALACLDLLVSLGVRKENIIVTDSKGVIYQGRTQGMDEYKQRYAANTDKRTLAEALDGADIFLGLSVAGMLKAEMVEKMVEAPLILALANPVPEIMPEEARRARPKAIIATGRSDYPNQVNNVLCFPFIFRGALDVGATQINEEMQLACVRALADLVVTDKMNFVSADASDVLATAYAGEELRFGQNYIIPKPFDPRLIAVIPPAVAKAAMDTGIATKPISDFEAYTQGLAQYMFRSVNVMKTVHMRIKNNPQRLVYCEGEDPRVLRAAQVLIDEGCVRPILMGRRAIIEQQLLKQSLRIRPDVDFQLIDPFNYERHAEMAAFYHQIMGRHGISPAAADVIVRTNTTVLAALLLRLKEVDAVMTGPVSSAHEPLQHGLNIIGLREGVSCAAAMQMLILDEGTFFITDTSVNYEPTAKQLSEITGLAAEVVSRFGMTPKVALLSHSNFGSANTPSARKMREALQLIHDKFPMLECEGEMQTDSAVSETVRQRLFPDSNLHGSANLFVMPNQDAASITYNSLKALADGVSVGPILLGMKQPFHILSQVVTTRGVVNLSMIAADDALTNTPK